MVKALLLAALLLLSGCGPSDITECRMEAAKMPTPQGVSLAAMQCQKRFGFDAETARPAN